MQPGCPADLLFQDDRDKHGWMQRKKMDGDQSMRAGLHLIDA
ncbi:MAG: hypothetical protein RB296_07290 [Acidobacteriota bacterium]|nr:hypothetical protein [Acidobacteriota bacterium]